MKPMTKELAVAELRKLQNPDNIEIAHAEADEILCRLLAELGCQDVADEWDKVPKWYGG